MEKPFLVLARRENGDWLIITSTQLEQDLKEEDDEEIVAAWSLETVTSDVTIDRKAAMFLETLLEMASQEDIEREHEEVAIKALRALFRSQRLLKERGDEYVGSLETGLMRLLTTVFQVGQTFGAHIDPEEKLDNRLLLPRLELR